MEGISGMLIYTAIAAGFAVVFWLLYKFKDKGDIILEIAEPATKLAKSVARMLIKDKQKEDEAVKYIEILEATVTSVNRAKEEIREELGEDATAKQRHAAYREKAMQMADAIAVENGINPDVMSKTIATTAIDMILEKLPRKDVTEVDLENATHISN